MLYIHYSPRPCFPGHTAGLHFSEPLADRFGPLSQRDASIGLVSKTSSCILSSLFFICSWMQKAQQLMSGLMTEDTGSQPLWERLLLRTHIKP